MRESAALCIVARDLAEVTWPLLAVALSIVYSVAQQHAAWDEARGRRGSARRKRRSPLLRYRVSRFLRFNGSRMGANMPHCSLLKAVSSRTA
jgi:hypothetical protein